MQISEKHTLPVSMVRMCHTDISQLIDATTVATFGFSFAEDLRPRRVPPFFPPTIYARRQAATDWHLTRIIARENHRWRMECGQFQGSRELIYSILNLWAIYIYSQLNYKTNWKTINYKIFHNFTKKMSKHLNLIYVYVYNFLIIFTCIYFI